MKLDLSWKILNGQVELIFVSISVIVRMLFIWRFYRFASVSPIEGYWEYKSEKSNGLERGSNPGSLSYESSDYSDCSVGVLSFLLAHSNLMLPLMKLSTQDWKLLSLQDWELMQLIFLNLVSILSFYVCRIQDYLNRTYILTLG